MTFAASLSSGCDIVSRYRSCRELVRTINGALDQIEADSRIASRDRAAYERIAIRYETLGKELEALGVRFPELAASTSSYRQVTTGAANAARAAAREDGSPAAKDETAKLLKKARAFEATSLRAIASQCRG